MKRSDALSALRLAGYHNDSRAFTRTYVENRISYRVAQQEWRLGVSAKLAGVRCTCFECKEEKKS